MSALTAARNTPRYGDDPVPSLLKLPVKAATKIYIGALVALGIDGYVKPAASGATAAGDIVVGCAQATADNSTGANGDISLEIRQGVHKWNNSSSTDAITAADVGRPAYVVDDNTVARTSGSGARPVAGTIVGVDSAGVFVESRLPKPNGQDIELIAAADLSALGFIAIKVDSAGKAAMAGAGESAIGILQNAPASGAIAKVRTSGTSYALAGTGGIAKGALVASDAAGALVAATKASTNTSDAGAAADPLVGSDVLGTCIVNAAAGANGIVLLQPRGAVATTAA